MGNTPEEQRSLLTSGRKLESRIINRSLQGRWSLLYTTNVRKFLYIIYIKFRHQRINYDQKSSIHVHWSSDIEVNNLCYTQYDFLPSYKQLKMPSVLGCHPNVVRGYGQDSELRMMLIKNRDYAASRTSDLLKYTCVRH
jgi:hypothetical protein